MQVRVLGFMEWWECEDCKFFGKTKEDTQEHKLKTGHIVHHCGMQIVRQPQYN